MKLSDLKTGDKAVIKRHHTHGNFRKRLLEMGLIVGKEITVVKNAPLQDPVEYRILNYDVSLRRAEADLVEVELLSSPLPHKALSIEELNAQIISQERLSDHTDKDSKRIRVAFVGNPNCGKTSLFNAISGAHEHVGNYSGVTIAAKSTSYKYRGYTFELIDLPGTYSISSYSNEERFISDFLTGSEHPDIILNVVDASNLERNLYMTCQLMSSGLPVCVALNMYDELLEMKGQLDIKLLSKILGMPLIPTNGRKGEGIEALFNEVIKVYERDCHIHSQVEVSYHDDVEALIRELTTEVNKYRETLSEPISKVRPRHLAINLLESDQAVTDMIRKSSSKGEYLVTRAAYLRQTYQKSHQEDIQAIITDGRYAFIAGALRMTLKGGIRQNNDRSQRIDRILTHRIWGLPIFVLFMYLMFQATFTLGEYPMNWIQAGVDTLSAFLNGLLPEGPLQALLVDGILGGVGGVIVFLPNILILYFFISIMEDTGYMSRAAFIMDRLMHLFGLHGKSFIPLIMGFGCNVPAVMSTRTIESRKSRMITMLVLPFMSCSARLPVYLLLAGAFFAQYAGTMIFVIYFTGIILAILSALIFKKLFFVEEDTPFVMELPPYRIPTGISIVLHMWTKSKQYLYKMGTVILFASIVIWALGYFPHYTEDELITPSTVTTTAADTTVLNGMTPAQHLSILQQEKSYIGRIGHTIEPLFRPLGYDWRMSVALLSGAAAKEVVVSTMGVLYTGNDSEDDTQALTTKLQSAKKADGSPAYDPVIAFSFMLFVLIYFPCIATVVAIAKEAESWNWALFSVIYTIVLAWVVGYIATTIGHLLV